MAQALCQETVAVLPGQLYLFRRSRSSVWQARFKVESTWVRQSTKKRDLDEAKAAAIDLRGEKAALAKHGVPIVTRRFSSIAERAKQRMDDEVANGGGKVMYKHYKAAIDSYLIPFFGKHAMHSVDDAKLREFDVWRREKFGREPASSTLNNHNAALNRVFDEAVIQGVLTQSSVPQLRNKGKKSARRPDFTLEEYRNLYRFMRNWIDRGKKGKAREMRYLLRDYVLILANTGIRHGTESYSLKWKNISLLREDERSYLLVSVNGKTGPRELVARTNTIRYLQRLHKRQKDIAHLSFKELLSNGVDKHVFRVSDGATTTSLHQTFEVLMKDSNLWIDRRTDQRRTLYSLRHTYATFAIVYHGLSFHLLAKQMGTSIGVIEKYYSHLEARQKRAQLAGYVRAVETAIEPRRSY